MIRVRCLIAFVVGAFAAGTQIEAQLTPTFEIAPPRMGPAPGSRGGLKVVAGTTQFLAVWSDGRDVPRVWATRVSAEGAPLDGVGIPLMALDSLPPSGNSILTAGSDRSDYVVVSRSASLVTSTSAVVTGDGKYHVNDAALPSMYSATLLWLGTEYALVYLPTQSKAIRYLLLDRTGVQIGTPHDLITTANGTGSVAAAIGRGSTLVIAWVDSSDFRVHDLSVPVDDLRRGLASPYVATYSQSRADPPASEVALASDGTGYLYVWTEGPSKDGWTIHAQSLMSGGQSSSNSVSLGAIDVYSHPVIAFDGSSYVVTFSNGRNVATTKFRDGLVESSATQSLTLDQFPAASVVSNASGSLLIWETPSQWVMAAPFPLPVIGTAQPARVISLGSAAQDHVQGQWRGDHYLLVWSESSDLGTIVYRRFDINGKPLDATGVTLSTSYGRFAIATDGEKSLVVWPDDGFMKAASIDCAGRATSPVILGPWGYYYDSPLVAWNGAEYVVVWTEVSSGPAQTVAARIGRDGGLIGNLNVVSPQPLDQLDLLIPINDGYYTVVQTRTIGCFPVCIAPTALYAGLLSPDLRLLGPSALISSSELIYGTLTGSPSYAKRGTDSLVVWAQLSPDGSSRIQGARVLGSGLPIDRPEGFVIGKGTHVTGVVATSTGFTVVGGAGSWNISPDTQTISPTTAYAFVPPDASANAYDAPNPFATLIAGGPRPLIIYGHPADEHHDVPYFVGAFAPLTRARAVRP